MAFKGFNFPILHSAIKLLYFIKPQWAQIASARGSCPLASRNSNLPCQDFKRMIGEGYFKL